MTDFNVRFNPTNEFKVTVKTGGVGVPARFTDLIDFDGDETYAYGDFISVDGATHFDDIVRFKSAPIIVQQCGPGACGNPS